MGSLVLKAKGDAGPTAINYGSWVPLQFAAATLASDQNTGTVAAVIPLLFAVKVLGLSVVLTTVNGTAPVAVNLASGVGPQGGVGPTDPLLVTAYPPTAAQMMQNGNILFATDQRLNGASAPVVNTPYRIYPQVVSTGAAWDMIWPGGSLMTLRISTGASAVNGVLRAIAWAMPIDIHPYLPNGANPFAPSAAQL